MRSVARHLGKYGDGDRAFWLEAYGGRPYVVDRRKLVEPLRIEYMAVSIVGGIQPDRLATLGMTGDDDGLVARFLYTWPMSVPPSRPRHNPDNKVVVDALRRMQGLTFRSILPMANPDQSRCPSSRPRLMCLVARAASLGLTDRSRTDGVGARQDAGAGAAAGAYPRVAMVGCRPGRRRGAS